MNIFHRRVVLLVVTATMVLLATMAWLSPRPEHHQTIKTTTPYAVAPAAAGPSDFQQALQRIRANPLPTTRRKPIRQRLIVKRVAGVPEPHDGPMVTLSEMQEVQLRHLPKLGMSIIRVPGHWNTAWLLAAVNDDPSVEYGGHDRELRVYTTRTPNDPRFPELWGLNQPNDIDINAPEAWAYTTGSDSVVVAVMDSGIDYTHVDLVDNIWSNEAEAGGVAGVDDDGNGYVDDVHGWDAENHDGDPWNDSSHGTWVSSVIGARGNNGRLLTGVNWNVSIMALKFIDYTGRGSLANFFEAAEYILTMHARGVNIKVVNASTGNSFEGESCELEALPPSRRLEYEAIEMLGEAGILFVNAATNERRNIDLTGSGVVDTPACYDLDNLIAVTSHSRFNYNIIGAYGATSVDLAVPGVQIRAAGPNMHSSSGPEFWSERKANLRSGGRNSFAGPDEDVVFFDDPANGDAGWEADPPWARSSSTIFTGARSWTDSPGANYADNINLSLTRDPIDLSDYRDDYLFLSLFTMTDLEYRLTGCTSIFCDVLLLEVSGDGSDWRVLEAWGGRTGPRPIASGLPRGWGFNSVGIPRSFYTPNFQFRFRLVSDSGTNRAGVYLHDIRITRHDEGSDTIDLISGTSFATPHVAGVAALLWAYDDELTVAQVRAALLDNVKRRPELAGMVASGGSLDAAASLRSIARPGIRAGPVQQDLAEGRSGRLRVSLAREPSTGRVVLMVSASPGLGNITTNTLTFDGSNWHRSQLLSFDAVNDNDFNGDSDEDLVVAVDAARTDANYEAPDVTVRVTVREDESGVIVRLSSPVTHLAEGATAAVVVTLSEVSGEPVTATLSTSGSAQPSDYELSQTQLEIPAGASSAAVVLSAVDDPEHDPGETVVLRIDDVGGAGAIVGAERDRELVLTLRERFPPRLSLAADPVRAVLGDEVVIAATLDRPVSETFTVRFVSDGSAIRNFHYVLEPPGFLVMPAGSTVAEITMRTRSLRVVNELSYTAEIRASLSTVEVLPPADALELTLLHTVQVIETFFPNPESGQLELGDAVHLMEEESTLIFFLTNRFLNNNAVATQVFLAARFIENGTATPRLDGLDYDETLLPRFSRVTVINPQNMSMSRVHSFVAQVTVTGDNTYEPITETAVFQLVSVDTEVLASEAAITLTTRDLPATGIGLFEVDNRRISEGDANSAVIAALSLNDHAGGVGFSIPYTITGTNVTADDFSSHSTLSGFFTFDANDLRADVEFVINNDDDIEGLEMPIIALMPGGYGGINVATNTVASFFIRDDEAPDDAAPTFGAAMIPDQMWSAYLPVFVSLPVATSGNGTLIYKLTPPDLPGITVALPSDRSTAGSITGRPAQEMEETQFTLTVTDSDTPASNPSESATLKFSVSTGPSAGLRVRIRVFLEGPLIPEPPRVGDDAPFQTPPAKHIAD